MSKLCCNQPETPTRKHDAAMAEPSFSVERASLIRLHRTRWINGSKIRWAMEGGSAHDRAQVIKAASEWQSLAKGLTLEQVDRKRQMYFVDVRVVWSDSKVYITRT